MKRVAMPQRTKPIARHKGLRSRSVLTVGKPLPRHARIKPVSDKRRAGNRERRKMADATFGPQPLCAIKWGAGCTYWADDLDEVLSRGRGGSITDAANTNPACRWCHTQKTANPAEAERRGFLLPSGRPRKAVAR